MSLKNCEKLTVYVEDTKETIILSVSSEEMKRAAVDATFLADLVQKEYNKRNQKLCSKILYSDCNSQSSSKSSTSTESINLPMSPKSRESNCEEKNESENEKPLFIWPSQLTFLLLEKYEKREEEFQSGTKRHQKIWNSIAADMQKVNLKYTMTGQQCQSKLNGLKKTYKKILDHNSVSGNDHKTWTYFERMHEIFGKSGWANPKAIASESGPSTSQSSFSLKNDNVEQKNNKRKADTTLNEILQNMKNKQIKKEEDKKETAVRFEKLMQQKDKQHEEKMSIMKQLLHTISNNKK